VCTETTSGEGRKACARRSTFIAFLTATTAIVTVLQPVAASSQTARTSSPAQATSAATRNYSIPAGPLAQALNRFADASQLQLIYSGETTRGLRTDGLSGTYTPQQALDQLLSGSGLTYRFSGRSIVTIQNPGVPVAVGGAPAGAIQLDTVDVSGGRGRPEDRPFQTPGSVNYISEQDIQRFRGNTAGDMFQGTPGVISGMNRNGAAIDVNIRGLQGMNRVATTIDGSEQSTSSYRGYSGVDNRTYVDPDLISGVTITKGPSDRSAGAIGGTVAMETLNASDILRPGDIYGVRIKAGVSNNGTDPRIGSTSWLHGPLSGWDFNNKSGSAAFAVTQPNIDIVAAYVRRISGNYFAGTQGALDVDNFRGGTKPLSRFKYGDEVFNTSQNSTSALLKATMRPADGHELQLGYMRYENNFGEVMPTLVISTGTVFTLAQLPLSKIALDQFTARYHWKPVDNNLIDFKANAWMSATDEVTSVAGITSEGIGGKSKNYGFEASNASRFDIASTPFTLRYGGSLKLEDAESDYRLKTGSQGLPYSIGPDGTRQIGTLFVNGKWEPLPWLAFDAGATYLTYNVENRATPEWSYRGKPYTPYEGSGVSPNFGVTVTPVEGWQLFGQYRTGVRPPSLRESVWTASNIRFNPDIVAEKARNWEVGTNLLRNDLFVTGDKARLKFAYFNNVTADYIGRRWDTTKVSDQYLTLFNYDKVVMKGFELSGGYDVKKGFVDVAFNYYTDVEMCRTASTCTNGTGQADYLANQIPPRFSASATGGLRFFDEKLTLGGRYTYMGARAATVEEDDYSKTLGILTKAWAPYSLIDVFAQWKINENLTLDVSAENLLDRYYVDALNNTDMPAPGRTIRASLTGKLGNSTPPPPGQLFNRSAGAVPGADWTGLYVGGHAGQGFASLSGVTTAMNGTAGGIPATESIDMNIKNFLLGGQIGFNYQFDNRLVIGVEADFSKTRLSGFQEALATEGTLPAQRNLQAKTEYEFDWMATIRGRVGYAFDRLLVYGTGGLAFLNERQSRDQYRSDSASASSPSGSTTSLSFTESVERRRTGWTLGVGAEYAITGNWSVKGEYAYAGFGEEDFNFPNARQGVTKPYSESVTVRCTPWPACFLSGGPPFVTTTTNYPGSSDTVNGRKASNAIDLHTIKIGLNYRF
jgi:hemoglobin/transferrin/lactoferrin receptor protein